MKEGPSTQTLICFPWRLSLLALQAACKKILSVTSVSQRLSLFGRNNNKQYYTTCSFQKTFFFSFTDDNRGRRELGFGYVLLHCLTKFSVITMVCRSLGEKKKSIFFLFLAWHIRICRILCRQRKGLVYFCPYPMLYERIVLFYTVTTNIMQCTICFLFH